MRKNINIIWIIYNYHLHLYQNNQNNICIMQSIPQPHVKIQIGSEAIFLCDANGMVRKQTIPIYKYFINPLYKQS